MVTMPEPTGERRTFVSGLVTVVRGVRRRFDVSKTSPFYIPRS